MIDVALDERNARLAASLMRSAPSLVQKAAVNAVNRTIITTRKEISKSARGRYVVKAAEVKRALSIDRAKGQSPRGAIIAKGAPLSLSAFRLRERKRGSMRVQVLRESGLRPVKGLFVKQFPRGYSGPMLRAQRARYPLASPYGPSVPKMVENQEVLEHVVPIAEETLNQRFLHEISWRLSKK